MRTSPRATTLLVAFIASLAPASSAFAADGGAAVGGASTAKSAKTTQTAPPAGSGSSSAVQTRTVALTRSQTKSVQRRVRVKPDGALGSGTRRALRKYQRVQALTLTGAPNVETLRKMGLKIADKIEAKLLAEAQGAPTDGDATTEQIAAPSGELSAAIAAARTAIGTPYRSAGTTTAGFDCSGLTLWAFKQAGITLPRTSFQQYREGTDVPRDQIQPGDLVFFNSAGGGASHVGIATAPDKVISATTRGVMEHTFASGYWDRHYVGARRITPSTAVKAALG